MSSTDVRGIPIETGDLVAYPVRSRSHLSVTVGMVLETVVEQQFDRPVARLRIQPTLDRWNWDAAAIATNRHPVLVRPALVTVLQKADQLTAEERCLALETTCTIYRRQRDEAQGFAAAAQNLYREAARRLVSKTYDNELLLNDIHQLALEDQSYRSVEFVPFVPAPRASFLDRFWSFFLKGREA